MRSSTSFSIRCERARVCVHHVRCEDIEQRNSIGTLPIRRTAFVVFVLLEPILISTFSQNFWQNREMVEATRYCNSGAEYETVFTVRPIKLLIQWHEKSPFSSPESDDTVQFRR